MPLTAGALPGRPASAPGDERRRWPDVSPAGPSGPNGPSGQADQNPCQPGGWRLCMPAPMPAPRQIAKYTLDALLIFAPLSGVIYFLFDPDAFNAFLNWLVRIL
jgi:hypothetical protein